MSTFSLFPNCHCLLSICQNDHQIVLKNNDMWTRFLKPHRVVLSVLAIFAYYCQYLLDNLILCEISRLTYVQGNFEGKYLSYGAETWYRMSKCLSEKNVKTFAGRLKTRSPDLTRNRGQHLSWYKRTQFWNSQRIYYFREMLRFLLFWLNIITQSRGNVNRITSQTTWMKSYTNRIDKCVS